MFGPSPPPSSTTSPWASNGSPVTLVSPVMKKRIYLPKLVPPCPLPPVVSKVRYFQYHNWRRHISHSYLNYQVPEVSSEELFLSRPIRCELSRLRCHGHSFLRIFTGSVGRRILLLVPVDILYRTSIISSSTVLPLNLFVNLTLASLSLSLYSWPMVQTLGCGPIVWSPRSSSATPSLGKGRVPPPPPLWLPGLFPFDSDSRLFKMVKFWLRLPQIWRKFFFGWAKLITGKHFSRLNRAPCVFVFFCHSNA